MEAKPIPIAFVEGREPKRQMLLEAALRLFTEYGYRKTSVEDIAAAAGVGKGTVYLYFENKEAVFRALIENFGRILEVDTAEALARSGTTAERLYGLLDAKYGLSFRVLKPAKYAAELMSSTSALAGDVMGQASAKYRKALVSFLKEEVLARDARLAGQFEAKELCGVLQSACEGFVTQAASAKEFEALMRGIARLVCGG